MKINKLLTPHNHNIGHAERIKYIVIHYVGATGSAKANCKYYASQYIGASAHYYVDFDGSIWQSVEDKDIAWHCGAKTYKHPDCRNANSIGIEMCVRNKNDKSDTSKDWYFEDATVEMAIKLTKELMTKYGVPADHVIRHYDVTGKICPNPYVYNHTKHTWDSFKSALNVTVPTKPTIQTYNIKTGKLGVVISVDSTLSIRDYPKTGNIIGNLKNGEHIHPDKKTFVQGDVWYHLPDKDGWISAKYIDGGWVHETSISSTLKWWYIHKNYTCTTHNIEIINGKIYKFNAEGYMLENFTGKYKINGDGEINFD